MAETAEQTAFNPETTKITGDFAAEFGEPSFKAAERARRPFERQALVSFLFWAGQQWVDVYQDNRLVYARRDIRPDQCEEVRRINNQLPMYTRQNAAAMARNMRDFEAVPVSYANEIAVEQAQIGTRALKWRDRMDNERQRRQEEILWLFGAAESLRMTYYDAGKGKREREGDIETEVVDFFHYLKDPQSADKWPPRWLIHYDARDVDEIKNLYGEGVEPESVADAMRSLDRMASNVVSGYDTSREPLQHSAILKRLYVPPGERYPAGYCWIWANGKLLDEHKLQSGRFPFSRAQWFPIPGRLYPISLIELLLKDQIGLNTLLSQLQELMNRQLRLDIITRGTDQNITSEVIDPKSGRKQTKIPVGCEEFKQAQYLADLNEAFHREEALIRDMHEKAASNKPTLGQDVGRQTRVGELMIAKEADMEALGWHLDMYSNDHLATVNEQKLALMKDYYKDFRLIELFNDPEGAQLFTGADLGDTKSVVAIPTPQLSPAMKQQAEIQAQMDGLLGPYPSPGAQLAARLSLRRRGLSDLEQEIAQVYGPLDDLKMFVGQIEQMNKAMLVKQAQMAMEALANPPPTEPGVAATPQEAMAA